MTPISDHIWTVDGELSLLGSPFGVRMTIVRLSNGSLWIHSPISWAEEYREQLDELGQVAYLIAPNNGHNKWLLEWHEQFPTAQVYVTPGTPKKKQVSEARQLTGSVDAWQADLDGKQIPAITFFDEVVFLHHASRSLIVTDIIQNHINRPSPKGLAGIIDRYLLRPMGAEGISTAVPLKIPGTIKNKEQPAQFLQEVLAWDFERIIPCHGDIIEQNAKRIMEDVLQPLFNQG